MRVFLLFFTFLIASLTSFSQTYFYKRVKIVDNGVEYNVQDDGHYMTIGNNCIYDSDVDGFCIGNSNMKYIKTENGIRTYYGQTYFGQCYCFAARDFKRLNIKDDNKTYVYVLSMPSSNIKLRSTSNSSLTPPLIINTPSNQNSSSGNSRSNDKRRVCPSCNGTGKGMDQVVYRPDYTGNQHDEYCSKCGKWGSPHSHRTPMCGTCYGKGYLNF